MRTGSAGTGAPRRPDTLTLAAFAIVVLLLGLNFVGVRFSNRELDPMWGAFLRFLAASAVLLGIVRWRRLVVPRGAALAGAVLYGFLTFGASYAFGYWGMVHVTAGTGAVIFATFPLTTLMLAVLFGLEALSWQRVLGALTVIGGIGIVFYDQLQAAIPPLALASVFLSTITSSLGVIVVKRFPRCNPLMLNAVGMPVGAAFLGAAALLRGEATHLPQTTLTWTVVALLAISSLVAFVLMVWMLGRWTASATSYVMVLMPLVTVLTGALLASETVTILFAVGGLVVLLGVYVGALTTPKKHALAAKPAESGPGLAAKR